jgi:hypothetical protein
LFSFRNDSLNSLLIRHLRRGHKMRQGKNHSRSGDRGSINIVNGVSIHARSKDADKRRSIAHWEGDLVTGSSNTHIATLVDRKTQYIIILKLPGKDSASVKTLLKNVWHGRLHAITQKWTDMHCAISSANNFSEKSVVISRISPVQLAGSVTKPTLNRPFICPILGTSK